jgi:hypothetical protein
MKCVVETGEFSSSRLVEPAAEIGSLGCAEMNARGTRYSARSCAARGLEETLRGGFWKAYIPQRC